MANRNFNRYQALEKEIKALYAEVAIGATGAPTITKALGITSVVRSGAGKYTITLDDTYTRFMSISIMQENATEQDLTFQLDDQTVGTTKLVKFICKAAATATDPSDGSNLFIKIDLKNSVSGE
jgi:hypothetical protein